MCIDVNVNVDACLRLAPLTCAVIGPAKGLHLQYLSSA